MTEKPVEVRKMWVESNEIIRKDIIKIKAELNEQKQSLNRMDQQR